jgi:ACR3 family arsenite transporter
MSATAAIDHPAVVAKLPMLDRMLPVWIGVAMIAGLLLGRIIPGLGNGLSAVEVDGISPSRWACW